MAGIWKVMMLAGCAMALINGRVGETVTAVMEAGSSAVSLALKLIGAMTLWGGLMGILDATGDVQRIGRWFRRILQRLFRGVNDEACWESIGVNLTANLLGLGNAATPAGMDAARRLGEMGREGQRGLAMLLVINSAGLQLIPTTVIMLRSAAGAAAPADLWGVILLSSAVSAVTGVAALMLLRFGGDWVHAHIRRGDAVGCGDHCAAGVSGRM